MTQRLIVVFASLLFTVSAFAIDTGKAFDDPEMQARYERLIAETRCVTCQNQSIKDSNAFIAADLRREIQRLMSEGKSDEEIVEFLVTRYGDFVLYRPRMAGKTMLLWIAPFAFILFAIFVFIRVLRHRMALPMEDEVTDDGPTQ
jgi:cytochrome c-type biogenesis protein CcmH